MADALQLVRNEQISRRELPEPLKQVLWKSSKGEGSVRRILRGFLEANEISQVDEINYDLRCSLEWKLDQMDVSEKVRKRTVAVLDRMKIEQFQILGVVKKCFSPQQPFFQQERLFLLYVPDYKTAVSFRQVHCKEDLLWDLAKIPGETLRNQVRLLLCEILNQEMPQRIRRNYLEPLKVLVRFCVRYGIADLLQLEEKEERRFLLYVQTQPKSIFTYAGRMVEFCRRTLFLKQKDICWQALVWYLDRFLLPATRTNASCPIHSFSFLEIKDRQNRMMFQEYIRYLVGISDFSLKAVQVRFYNIRHVLIYLDQLQLNLTQVSFREWGEYFLALGGSEVRSATYNKAVLSVSSFLHFLRLRGYQITEMDVRLFLKKTVSEHNDRMVSEEIIERIFKELPSFPEHLQMMYLVLFCTGLRKSEICMLKGNAAFVSAGESWLRVYQTKMKREKVIPVPSMLVTLLQEYRNVHQIGTDDYLFPAKDGGAFRALTFTNQMIEECKKRGIMCGNYIFRAHDYRHVLATRLYQSGVSLQGVRGYLDHRSDNMTKQYLDQMPGRLVAKSRKYYQKTESFRLE